MPNEVMRRGRRVRLSVVMPAYNEAQHIVSNLLETIDTLAGTCPDFEIVIVDDGSADNTYLHPVELLAELGDNIRIVRYHKNAGKGNALMCGFDHCAGDIVAFLDADMDLHPAQISSLLEILETRPVDVVIGSKWHRRSKINYPWIRKAWSFGYYLFVRLLFGLPLRDTQTGLKVFRAQVLRDVFPRILAKRYAFDVEVLVNAHHLGYKIADAPVTLQFTRTSGRVKIADVWTAFLDTLAIFYRLRVVRYYDRKPLAHAPGRFEDVEVHVGLKPTAGIEIRETTST